MSEVKVVACLMSNVTHEFPARNRNHAKEIAKRIIMEGLWVKHDNKLQEFYPVHQVYKVKVVG